MGGFVTPRSFFEYLLRWWGCATTLCRSATFLPNIAPSKTTSYVPLPTLRQAAKLLPKALVTGDADVDRAASQALATKLGQFLRVCPGLSKLGIGEMLGEPDAFYLEVCGSGHEEQMQALAKQFVRGLKMLQHGTSTLCMCCLSKLQRIRPYTI